MSIQNELTKLYKKLSEEGLNKEAQRLTPFIKESQFFTFLQPKHNKVLRKINRAIRSGKTDDAKDLIDSEDLKDLLQDTALKNDLKSALEQGDRRGFMKTLKSILKLLKNNKNITFSAVKAEADKAEGAVEQTDSTGTKEKTEDSGSATIGDEKPNEGVTNQREVSENASTETADSTGKSYEDLKTEDPVVLNRPYDAFQVVEVKEKDGSVEKIITENIESGDVTTVSRGNQHFKPIMDQLESMGYPKDYGPGVKMKTDKQRELEAKQAANKKKIIQDLVDKKITPIITLTYDTDTSEYTDLEKVLIKDGPYTWIALQDVETLNPAKKTGNTFNKVYFMVYDGPAALGAIVSEAKALPKGGPTGATSAFKVLFDKAKASDDLSGTLTGTSPAAPSAGGPGGAGYTVSENK